jgi:hypothetical protein
VDVAERAHLGDGRLQAATVLTTVKRDQLAAEGKTPGARRGSVDSQPILDKYEHEGRPTTPPPACGTMGFSTRPRRAARWPSLVGGYNAPIRSAVWEYSECKHHENTNSTERTMVFVFSVRVCATGWQ